MCNTFDCALKGMRMGMGMRLRERKSKMETVMGRRNEMGELLNGVSKVYNNGTKPHSIRLRFAHITRILPICVVVDFKSFLYKLNKQII